MRRGHTLDGFIPRPVRVEPSGSRLPAAAIESVYLDAGAGRAGERLLAAFARYGRSLAPTDGAQASVGLVLDPALAAEAWRLEVTGETIRLAGGGAAGALYGVLALEQMLAVGYARGASRAAFDGGVVEDAPRFEWRGFMLDSARHFQPVALVKQVLRLLAAMRLNVFHWHLTDGQGWRLPTESVRGWGDWDAGGYSRADLAEIRAFAAEHFIRIVPELDMPGHCEGLLRRFPQFACNPGAPGNEICLGNPAGKAFLKQQVADIAEFFPDSPVIHLGGDEAGTAAWESCPACRRALEEAGLGSMRELENRFMVEMGDHARSLGRQPMVWCTGSVYPKDTIIQAWQSVNEVYGNRRHGNPMVDAVHSGCYFDYPAHSEDPSAEWMPALSEESVYNAPDPFPEAPDWLLGTEACLWSEYVPAWRIMAKIAPRLRAFSEKAWSLREHRDWHGFLRRERQLEAAGYYEALWREDGR